MTEKEKIARQALMCLVAEAGRSVANDVKTKVEAVLAEKDKEIARLRGVFKIIRRRAVPESSGFSRWVNGEIRKALAEDAKA